VSNIADIYSANHVQISHSLNPPFNKYWNHRKFFERQRLKVGHYHMRRSGQREPIMQMVRIVWKEAFA